MRHSSRTLIFLLFCTIILVACALILIENLPTLVDTSAGRAKPLATERFGEAREETPVTEVAAVDEPEIQPRELPIVGRVVDGELEPLADVEIRVGEESVVSDLTGQFTLDATVRAGPLTVRLLRAGEEVQKWDGVSVGDGLVDLGGGRPVSPGALRWSMVLFDTDRSTHHLKPTSALVEEWRPGGMMRVAGATGLPDGLHVQLAVLFEGQPHVASPVSAEIVEGRFEASFFLPEDFRFYSDVHELRLAVSTELEDYHSVEALKIARPEFPWDELGDYQIRFPIYIGFPAEEVEDDRRVQAYYGETLGAVVGLKNLFQHWFELSMKLAKGWDPALLDTRGEHAAFWFPDLPTTRDGKLNEEAWRRFVDQLWRPELSRLLERHERKRREKYQQATYHMGRLLKGMWQLSYLDSGLLYQFFGLPPHPNDDLIAAGGADVDRLLLLRVMEEDVSILGGYLDLAERAKSLRDAADFQEDSGSSPSSSPDSSERTGAGFR